MKRITKLKKELKQLKKNRLDLEEQLELIPNLTNEEYEYLEFWFEMTNTAISIKYKLIKKYWDKILEEKNY